MAYRDITTGHFYIEESWGLIIAIIFVIATYIITICFIISDNTVARCILDLEDRVEILEEMLSSI